MQYLFKIQIDPDGSNTETIIGTFLLQSTDDRTYQRYKLISLLNQFYQWFQRRVIT